MPTTISSIEARRRSVARALDILPDAPEAEKSWGVATLAGTLQDSNGFTFPTDFGKNTGEALRGLQEVYRTNSIEPLQTDDFKETEELFRKASGGDESAWDELEARGQKGDSFWKRTGLTEENDETLAGLLDESVREEFRELSNQMRVYKARERQDPTKEFGMQPSDASFGLLPASTVLEQGIWGDAERRKEVEARYGELRKTAVKRARAMRHVERVRQKNALTMLNSIAPELSNETRAVIDRAVTNGYKVSDKDAELFAKDESEGGLPDEQKRLAAAFLAYCKPIEGSGIWAAMGKRFGDSALQVTRSIADDAANVFTSIHGRHGDEDGFLGLAFDSDNYRERVQKQAWLRTLNARNFADLGWLGNSFAEAGTIAGYWTPQAVGWGISFGAGGVAAGLAKAGGAGAKIVSGVAAAGRFAAAVAPEVMYFADYRQQFLTRVAMDGGDVASPVLQLAATIGGMASAYIEHLQWGRAMGKVGLEEIQSQAYARLTHRVLARLGVKVGTEFGKMTAWDALKTVIAERGLSVVTEGLEEALQQAIEDVVVDIGEGKSIRIADLAETSSEAFTQSLLPMAWTMFTPWAVARRAISAATMHNLDKGAIERLMSASERLKRLAQAGKLTDGREDAASLNQLMFAVTHAPNARAAVGAMLRRGFSLKQAVAIVANFHAIAREAIERGQLGELGENVLPTQEELERTGWQVTPNADGTFTASRDVETEDGKRRRQTLNIRRIASQVVDVNDAAQAASVLNYMRGREAAARAGYAALGIDLSKSDAELLADPNVRNALALVAAREELRTVGDTKLSETRQTQDAQGNAIDEDVFDVTLAEQATRQTIFHEVAHAIAKTLRNMGLTEKEVDAIQNWRSGREGRDASEADMALPELNSELWNEERVGDEMGDILAGADEASKGRVAKAMNLIGDLARRVLRIQKRQDSFRDAVAVMEEVVRRGKWGNIDELTDAQKRLLLKARERRAAGEQARREQAAKIPASSNAVIAPTPTGEPEEEKGPSSEGGGTKLATDRTPLDRVTEAFCFNKLLLRADMALLAASGELSEDDIYETGYRWSPLLRCWVVRSEVRGQKFTPNGPYMGLDGEWKGETARKAVSGRHSLVALQEIASGKEYGILHNDRFGEIRYPLGKAGKGGLGFLHIVEHRMNGGASLDEAIETAIRVGMAAEIGKETFSKFNTHHLDVDGVRAIIAVMPDNTIVITGYEIDADETAAANRRAEEHNPHPHVSSDEVIKRLQEALARKLAEINSENAPRASVSPSRLPSPEFAMDGTIVDALPRACTTSAPARASRCTATASMRLIRTV